MYNLSTNSSTIYSTLLSYSIRQTNDNSIAKAALHELRCTNACLSKSLT